MFKEFKETMAKKFKENVLTDPSIRNLKNIYIYKRSDGNSRIERRNDYNEKFTRWVQQLMK